MQEFSGLRSLEGFRSLAGSTSTAVEAADPNPSPDTGGTSDESLANLKTAAEKLVEEQASVKTDLEMAHVQLRRATEQINLLEGKLQQAVNENAKLKVKQTENSKLWQGLDSKLSSTKTWCDQLTETLQQLASQTEQAEEDKKCFEEMLGKNSKDLDEFNCMLRDLSTKLEDAEQKITSGRQEILQIKQEKEEMDRSYKERLYSYDTMIKEKDSLIKQLEGSVDENKSCLICLDSHLQCMEQELKVNDDVCISLKGSLASSESEKSSLELMNKGHILETEKLCQDNKDIKESLSSFMVKVTELDKELASMSSHMSRLIPSFERFYEMAEEEMLLARSSKDKFEHLQRQHVDLTSENNALKTNIEELMFRLTELQRTQEAVMVQHFEECEVVEDKIRILESEAEVSASNINQLEKLASELQGRIQKLLEDSTLAENHKQKLLQKILNLKSDNQELLGQVQSIMEEKSNNAESLQGEITKRDRQVNTLENQINKLHSVLDEKEQHYRCCVEREKTLEDQKLKVEASLSATECQLSEAKKQYDLMLEQAINEIHKIYELEKVEITNAEKEKAEKLIREIESKCNEKISKNKHDSERHLISLKKEHGTMVSRIQQDNEHKESTLRDYHKEELQRIQSQAENELRKRLSLLRNEHELQIKSLEEECLRMQEELKLQKYKVGRIQQDNEHKESTLRAYHKEELQHIQSQAENELRKRLSLLRNEHELQIKSLEEECLRMQEELKLLKYKLEETQRTLLQLHWKVMGENQQVDQEVNSKKQDDNIWDKRQLMYLFVLTSTVGLVFLLQPLLPTAYSSWIIMMIAAVWGVGSIGFPFGLYGTSRCEKECSRHTGRLIYTVFAVFVIYGFYLVAMRTGDISAPTLSASLKEGDARIDMVTAGFCIIGLIVGLGNLWASIRGCWTGGDRDL